MKATITKFTVVGLAPVLAALFLLAPSVSASANAIGYDQGNLISENIFDDKDSMTTQQIQRFLSREGSGLANYQNTESCQPKFHVSSNFDSKGYYQQYYDCGHSKSAASIVHDAAQAYSINPRVILATLQKEQGLVTNPNPTTRDLKYAMGYGCPDSSGCSDYQGFFNQVDSGAWQFRTDIKLMTGHNWWDYTPASYPCQSDTRFYYVSGSGHGLYPNKKVTFTDGNNTHYRTVTLFNPATAALYCYTPHAYNNPKGLYNHPTWGTQGHYYSGSYNFIKSYQNWWGSTSKTYQSLQTPRWLQLKADTYKKNPATGENVDSQLKAGQQIYFSTKIKINGVSYLRTKHDTGLGYNKGIPYSALEEVPIDYISLKNPRWMETKADVRKVDPATGKPTGAVVPAGTQIYFPTKFDIGNKTYLRTQHDMDNGLTRGFLLDDLSETDVEYKSFVKPRWMQAVTETDKLNLKSHSPVGKRITKGSQGYYDHKVKINDNVFARKGAPTSEDQYIGVRLSDLGAIPYTPAVIPRHMLTSVDVRKQNPVTGEYLGDPIPAGTSIYFPSKIIVDNKTYLRTNWETQRGLQQGFLYSKLMEDFVDLVHPRYLITKKGLYKVDLTTHNQVGQLIPKGTKIFFPTKVDIGDNTYLRTQDDTDNNRNVAIPYEQLENAK